MLYLKIKKRRRFLLFFQVHEKKKIYIMNANHENINYGVILEQFFFDKNMSPLKERFDKCGDNIELQWFKDTVLYIFQNQRLLGILKNAGINSLFFNIQLFLLILSFDHVSASHCDLSVGADTSHWNLLPKRLIDVETVLARKSS